jgi:ferredoxin
MNKTIRIVRDNLFLAAVVLGYIALFILRPETGVTAAGNSVYYIKEMLSIMPVIFILTALLDVWVPKQTIIRLLGSGSGVRGLAFSFILGGISAGPIYAAFPFCVMLHRKGASIRNVVVILSSWAVIKAPMLLNEVKFLGVTFMAARWVLTVTAILIFSWITAKIIRDEDFPQEETKNRQGGLTVHTDACIGCALCARNCPALFEMQGGKAAVRKTDHPIDEDALQNAIDSCPVGAIEYTREADEIGAGEAGRI